MSHQRAAAYPRLQYLHRLRVSLGRGDDKARAGLIVCRANQVVPGASLQAHVSLADRQNPPTRELPTEITHPTPPRFFKRRRTQPSRDQRSTCRRRGTIPGHPYPPFSRHVHRLGSAPRHHRKGRGRTICRLLVRKNRLQSQRRRRGGGRVVRPRVLGQ